MMHLAFAGTCVHVRGNTNSIVGVTTGAIQIAKKHMLIRRHAAYNVRDIISFNGQAENIVQYGYRATSKNARTHLRCYQGDTL